MPKGPSGEKRPADAIGLAVMVGKIATGEIEETPDKPATGKAKAGTARAASLTADRRSEIARLAASRRWDKTPGQ